MQYKRIEDITDMASLSKEERMMYDEAIKVYRDNLVTEAYALNKGREEGIAKGREEERIEIAHAMKAKNMPVDMIAEFTKLTKEEIDKI